MGTPLIWLIVLPLGAAPAVYVLGRLRMQAEDCRLRIGQSTIYNLQSAIPQPRWLALAALAGTWAPFAMVAAEFARGTAPAVALGQATLRFDGLSLLVAALALAIGTLAVLFCGPDLAGRPGEEKFYALVLMMVGGLGGLACATDLFNLWVWFELVAIGSYLVVGFDTRRPAALEASLKYLAQGAAGSALVLVGVALVLGQAGTLALDQIGARARPSPALVAAGALFVVGFGVKAALVPLHTWLPDAYAEAPSGASALLSAVAAKGSLVALLRALGAVAGVGGPLGSRATWGVLLLGFGALNMLLGNLLALRQRRIKRLLAYSSLGQLGYVLLGLGIGVYAGQLAGAQGGLFHAITHALMSALAFLAAGALVYATTDEPRGGDETLPTIPLAGSPTHPFAPAGGRQSAVGSRRPAVGGRRSAIEGDITIDDLAGVAGRYPLAALALSVAALGLAGLPPLAGFMSKWQIFAAGVATRDGAILALVGFAALNAVLSLAYYSPLVSAVYRLRPSPAVGRGRRLPLAMQAPLVVLALGVLALGVWPGLAAWLTEPAGQAILRAFGE